MPAATEGQPRQARAIIAVLPYLLDFIVPLVAFYALTAAGLSSFWSLTIGGALTGVTRSSTRSGAASSTASASS